MNKLRISEAERITVAVLQLFMLKEVGRRFAAAWQIQRGKNAAAVSPVTASLTADLYHIAFTCIP